MRRFFSLMVLCAAVSFVGCDTSAVEDAANSTVEAVGDAAQGTADAVEGAANDAADAAGDAVEGTKEAVMDAAEAVAGE